MATRNRAIVMCKWKTSSGNRAELEDDLPNGISMTDISGQPDDRMPPKPAVHLREVEGLTNAQLTALKAMPKYFVLMDESYDNVTNEIIASNYDNVVTAPQLISFKNAIQTRFPNVDDDKITSAGKVILRADMTRRQVLAELIERWKRFDKEPVIIPLMGDVVITGRLN